MVTPGINIMLRVQEKLLTNIKLGHPSLYTEGYLPPLPSFLSHFCQGEPSVVQHTEGYSEKITEAPMDLSGVQVFG